MWEDNEYCWVVVCKNRWFHMRQNMFLGIKFRLARQMPSRLNQLLRVVSRSDAMNAATSISTNPRMCGDTNDPFLSLSLPIRYFAIETTVSSTRKVHGISGATRPRFTLRTP
jgi:hypothetical protein